MTSDGGPYLGAFVRKREAQKKGFIWGEVRYRGPKHLITVGPPGACKSAGLVVPNVANLARSMLIIDPKGELAAITARKRAEFGRVVVLNPFGLFADELPHLKSDGFNPLRQLDPLSESFPDEAAAIASALIPIKSEHNKFFPLSARNIITAFVMWERMQRGEAAHLLDVRQSIMAPTAYGPDKKTPVSGFMKSIFDMAMSDYYPVADLGGRLFERLTDKGSHNTSVQDVLETLVAETGFLSSPPIAADLKGEGFDFRDMRREIVTVYLILPTAQIQTHAIWLRLIITSALRSLYQPVSLSDKATLPPVLFVLDEFAQLGRLDAIEAALGIARGSGVQLWPFLQDLSQLKDLYPDRWQTFFTGAGALTFFAPKDGFTAEFVSRQCGQKSERMVSQNTRESDSDAFGHRFESSYGWSEGGFPLFRPEELREIPPQQMLCFVEPCAQPIFTSAPPYPWTRYGLGLDQNPYFRG